MGGGGRRVRHLRRRAGLVGDFPLRVALPAMAGVHALIGIGEAVITVAALSSVLAVRPDLVAAWDRPAKLEEARP